MPTFSKFITSQRGAEQLLDSDGYIYSRKKSKDTALTSTWRCSKHNPPTKCKCHCYLSLSDHTEIEEVLYEITYYIQSNYPQLMVVVNYFEKTYLGSVTVDSEVRVTQVMTDYHLDRLSVGKTPSKRRRTCHTHLYDICSFYSTYPIKIEYVFAVAKYFGNDIE